MKIINILKQSLKSKRGITITKMLTKFAKKRFVKKSGKLNQEDLLAWLESSQVSFEQMAVEMDEGLWKESLEVSEKIRLESEKKLANIKYKLVPYL